MQKEIGGYFELELSRRSEAAQIKDYLCDSLWGGKPSGHLACLNTGRNSLEYVLRSLSDVRLVYIPYYTCDTVLEPLVKLYIPYRFYSIDKKLELAAPISLQTGEYLIYTNYFGVKDDYVSTLQRQYGSQLIVDNAQALYAAPTENCAYSPRKFVGIPDGGMAVCSHALSDDGLPQATSYDLCSQLLKRIDCGAGAGYADFRANSQKFHDQPIQRMSALTMALLYQIDFAAIRQRRMENFNFLHSKLQATNGLQLADSCSFTCPLVYPYYVESASLRQKLIENKVFVATYWPNVREWCSADTFEYRLCQYTLPIPIDQRYQLDDMKWITSLISQYK